MKKDKIKVRFAPSPTGYLHVGGARTCLFNWLYARANKGSFCLRIEDTDRTRSKKEFLDEILESLKWLGLGWDELSFQSQRFDLYRQHAKRLLDEDKAYLAEDGSGAVIFRVPRETHPTDKTKEETVRIDDLIHGPIEFDRGLIKDQVLIKSDQTPTYNFACVVDDASMAITHIIRGDDHISNTPKQLFLYKALGFKPPQFAHIPMILDKGGGRMSKRTGAISISEYRRMGFLSKALVNYLMLLGWSPGNNQEIISLPEAVEKFDIARTNKTAAAFDMDKLLWLNGQYIKSCDLQELSRRVRPFLTAKGFIGENNFNGKTILNILKLYRQRASTLDELAEATGPFFVSEIDIDPVAEKKFLSGDLSREFSLLKERFSALPDFDAGRIEGAFREAVADLKITTKQLIHPLRVALSGKTVGPGMFEFIEALGKEKTLERIERAIKMFKKDVYGKI